MTMVLFSPHHDDETLFAAFTILRFKPMVVTCFPSVPDYGDTAMREQETCAAMGILGGNPIEHWNGGDLAEQMRALDVKQHPERVFAPDVECSHPDHQAVAVAAERVFRSRLTTYHTYTESGKVRSGVEVRFRPEWVLRKMRALACYASQIRHPRANVFFVQDLREFYGRYGGEV